MGEEQFMDLPCAMRELFGGVRGALKSLNALMTNLNCIGQEVLLVGTHKHVVCELIPLH